MSDHTFREKPRKENRLLWVGLVVFCSAYLVNPTLGFIEMLPDNLPLIGNLDEAGATVLLLVALSKLGLSLPFLAPRNNAARSKSAEQRDVVDI